MATLHHRVCMVLAAWWALCGVFAAAQSISLPQVAEGESPQVALYYDGPQATRSEGPLDALQIANLLGHFNLRGGIFPLENYHPGDLNHYRAAFFVGTASGTRFPPGFLEDVRSSQRPFGWVGRHLESLLDTPETRRRFGFSYIDYRDDLGFGEVLYKGVSLPKEDPDLNLVAVSNADAAQVVATARNDDGETYPYALHHGRFWFFADIPFSYMEDGGRYLVFCDLLHDLLEIPHSSSSLALVRLEDVSTDIDGAALREIADRMARRRVPFQIALIPVFRKPSQGIEVRLTDRPSFVDALKYSIARGGTPVMHGVTHQYHGTTGDDFEFWDAINHRPVAGDSAEYVWQRLRMGLAEVFAAGIYPIAFETPHYAASETDYAALKAAFGLYYGRTMATPDLGSIQYFPYPVVDTFGRTVVPENLGYLPEENPDPQLIIQRARRLKVVRDGMASFYFHPFLNPDLLDETVQRIEALGYHFVSLRQFGGGMSFEGRWAVATSSGTVRLLPNNEFWRMRVYNAQGSLLREQVSERRYKGAVDVAVEVPRGGWASVECLAEIPRRSPPLTWSQKLMRWLNPERPAAAARAVDNSTASRSAWILWLDQPDERNSNNQKSYYSLLESFGYQVRSVPADEFSKIPADPATILALPEGAAAHLTEKQRDMILAYLRSGGGLIADGHQPWLRRIGFRWSGRRIPVSSVVDVLFPEMPLQWRPEELIERFEPPEDARQFMVDPESRQVLATAGTYGNGNYLYLAAPLDQHTSEATSHYPYFADYLEETFPRRSSLRSARLEVYFDPGYRQGADLNRLAAMWRQDGIRVVYAAAWQFYPGYEFDYDRLIRLAHENGIAVYAWFVLPQVSPRMWMEHPECRERTATGTDGNVGWRLLINLENAACFRSAMGWMKDLLAAHDWDGVNLAELNYDADYHDYLRPDRFVPMNQDVRSAFGAKEGFDPALLFETGSKYDREQNPQAWAKFLQFREDLVTELHRRVLEELRPLQREYGWEIIVTMLDSLHSSHVRPALGLNSNRIVELMNEFDFTLQVEDPAEHWADSAARYRRFAETYYQLVPERRRLMFDINVMADRAVEGTHLPSQLLTGTELAQTAVAAAAASGRVAIYSESTVASQDWELLGKALASAARLQAGGTQWNVDSPLPVRLLPAQNRPYYLDGRFWPAATGEGVLVPPGEHQFAFQRPWYRLLERGEMQTALLGLSADLLDAQASPTGISLRYDSPGRAVILMNRPPLAVRLEGKPIALPMRSEGGRWWLLAPRGEHSLQILTTTETGVVLNVWSWFSASAITAYGAATTLLMFAIYLYIRLRRLLRRKGAAG